MHSASVAFSRQGDKSKEINHFTFCHSPLAFSRFQQKSDSQIIRFNFRVMMRTSIEIIINMVGSIRNFLNFASATDRSLEGTITLTERLRPLRHCADLSFHDITLQ